jgi:hypothetical protein
MGDAFGSIVVLVVAIVGAASMLLLAKIHTGASFSEILFRWEPFGVGPMRRGPRFDDSFSGERLRTLSAEFVESALKNATSNESAAQKQTRGEIAWASFSKSEISSLGKNASLSRHLEKMNVVSSFSVPRVKSAPEELHLPEARSYRRRQPVRNRADQYH